MLVGNIRRGHYVELLGCYDFCAARAPSWKDVESSIAWWPEAGSGLGHPSEMATSRDNSKNIRMIFKGFPRSDLAKKHSTTLLELQNDWEHA